MEQHHKKYVKRDRNGKLDSPNLVVNVKFARQAEADSIYGIANQKTVTIDMKPFDDNDKLVFDIRAES